MTGYGRAARTWVLVAALAAAGCSGTGSATSGPSDPPRSVPSRPSSVATRAEDGPPPSADPDVPSVDRHLVDSAWSRAIDAIVGEANVSVAVGTGDRLLYLHAGDVPRIPASSQKLLTSMVALDTWGGRHRFPTSADARRSIAHGTLRGDLWLVGSGDPELDGQDLARLASALYAAGLRRVTGSVLGDTGAFDRGWWAPGWVRDLSRHYVRRATALAIDGNVSGSPEATAAVTLSREMMQLGIRVDEEPGIGDAPDGLRPLATIRSAPLGLILFRQNHGSVNFDAEMLAKALGAEARGEGASTADGAAALTAWAADLGLEIRARDGSGLSHDDRFSVATIVTLLLWARSAPWGDVLARSLPPSGEGTLQGRLVGVPVRAKTGTLFETPVSALAGYVRGPQGTSIAFAVLSRGLDKTTAIRIEDAVVRVLAAAPSLCVETCSS